METLAESPNLANIEFALARQDFKDHTLAANLVQIALVDAVLRHQKFQRLHAGDAWQRVVLGLMVFVASGLIEQGFEYRHHPLVVRFVPDGAISVVLRKVSQAGSRYLNVCDAGDRQTPSRPLISGWSRVA